MRAENLIAKWFHIFFFLCASETSGLKTGLELAFANDRYW